MQKRFEKYFKKGRPNECWEWLGSRKLRPGGEYGRFYRDGKLVGAHRVSYELYIGPVPKGMSVLHSCDNPPCVNPKHLRLGTHADNTKDKVTRGRMSQIKPYTYKARPTHCKHGHKFTKANTYWHPKRNTKHCKNCAAIRLRKHSQKIP